MLIRSAVIVTASWKGGPVPGEGAGQLAPPRRSGVAGRAGVLGQLSPRRATGRRRSAPSRRPGKMIRQAENTLQDGIARMKKCSTRARADGHAGQRHALAGADLDRDRQAGRRREAAGRPARGPLALVAENHPLVSRQSGLAVEVDKAALRAFVGAQQLDKAEAVMKSLGRDGHRRKATPSRAGTLTQIYIRPGPRAPGPDGALPQRAEDRRAGQGEPRCSSSSWRRSPGATRATVSTRWAGWRRRFLAWAAATIPAARSLPAQAKAYYQRAAPPPTARSSTAPRPSPKFAPSPEAVAGVRVRLARCLRRLGQLRRGHGPPGGDPPPAAEFHRRPGRGGLYLSGLGRDARPATTCWPSRRRPQVKRADGSEENLVWGWGEISRMVATRGFRLPCSSSPAIILPFAG